MKLGVIGLVDGKRSLKFREMGLSLEFYAGNATTIGADFTASELDGIRDGTRALAYADLRVLRPSRAEIRNTKAP